LKFYLLTYVHNYWDGAHIKPVALLTNLDSVDSTIENLKNNKDFLGQIDIKASKLSRNYFEVQEFCPDTIYLDYTL
jgi:hypothetical protein